MTRFEREWNGELGEFWKKHAREEAQRLLDQADKIEVEDDGAAKWKTNGSYLPADVVEKLTFAGATWFSPEATEAKRETQIAKELEAYRGNHRGLDAEMLAEARAAFGEGTTICDVITGEKITL